MKAEYRLWYSRAYARPHWERKQETGASARSK